MNGEPKRDTLNPKYWDGVTHYYIENNPFTPCVKTDENGKRKPIYIEPGKVNATSYVPHVDCPQCIEYIKKWVTNV
jgi:hypothetical protein